MKKLFLRNSFCSALAASGLMLAGAAQAASINVPQILAGTNNWYHTNIYTLNGASFVMSNAVLNIEAGTVIKGHNLGGQGTNVAALYITRGAKIYAEGTPHHPIIFTADVDDTTVPDDIDIYARGLWGGLVIFGSSVLNGAIDAGGNAAAEKYEVYEGLADITVGGQQVFRFGGNNDNDNSGVLRYVSLRHGGAVLAPNKEINGLSLGAVGRGTTIEYVESYCAADDGFEFFGGTVNTKYLVSSFNDDDSFDTDMGYRGTNQFWFAIQAPDKRNYGMELNNHPNELPQTSALTPASDFKVYNLTIIGAGANQTNVNGGANHAIALRPWAGPKIYNAIFTDFNAQGVFLDTQNGVTATNNGLAQLHNTLWWNFTIGSGNTNISNTATNLGRNTSATNYWTDLSLTNQIANPQLIGISRTNVGGAYLDPRPAAGSVAYTDCATPPNDGFLTQVKYRGAFGSNDLWIANWTALAEYGILQPASIHTNNVAQILTGTNYWYRTNIYVLNGASFVMSNAVLNIEAGTVIKGHNLGGQGTNVAALYITRGAKIYAEGTPQNPIIFTADVDDTTVPDDIDIYARGLWGGLVIFGSSVLNGAIDAGGNAAAEKYEVYEGLADITVGGQQVFRFGGNNDNDNSGVLRYVSLRHGGAVLAPNKEINGLSLGAVGRGTTIEYVESYCAADDGFEFFGGTVNTKYLVSSFNDDDSFDTDMGYRGTNQFWFAIQAPDKRNYGMELNNHPNELPQTSALTPASDFKVYNLTIIGAGANQTNVNGGANHAIALRPWAGPKIYNAIFTDFNAQGVFLDTQNGVTATNNGLAQLHNTLWWNFTIGSGNTNISNTATNLGRNTSATNYWTDLSLTNQIANPQLIGISRTNVGTAYLDPRPKAGSPAYSGYSAAPAGYATANYVGAFGPDRGNWASDWTALSEYGIMGGAGGNNGAIATASVVLTPNKPVLVPAKSGGNLNVLYLTQSGFSYQLQSTTNLVGTIVWADEGGAVAGTGGTVTSTVPAAASIKLFRVKVQ
jgi:hypothetical protein